MDADPYARSSGQEADLQHLMQDYGMYAGYERCQGGPMPHDFINPLHPSLNLPIAVADGLTLAVQELIKESRKRYHAAHRRRVGSTLRPGVDTPTWNALVAEITPYLRRRGEKIKLARWLGVYPSRVHEYFQRRRSMPDAERTLLLLQYLSLRSAGRCPG